MTDWRHDRRGWVLREGRALLPWATADEQAVVAARFSAAERRGAAEQMEDAWNAWTGASAVRAGRAEVGVVRCPSCSGRLFSMHTGRVCMVCAGRGNTYVPTVAARWAKPRSVDHHVVEGPEIQAPSLSGDLSARSLPQHAGQLPSATDGGAA